VRQEKEAGLVVVVAVYRIIQRDLGCIACCSDGKTITVSRTTESCDDLAYLGVNAVLFARWHCFNCCAIARVENTQLGGGVAEIGRASVTELNHRGNQLRQLEVCMSIRGLSSP